jgi:hypothetical protein
MWNWLTGRASAPSVRTPLTPGEARNLGITRFVHWREWVCGCGASLRIRATAPRGDGPSNFAADVPTRLLTWDGLAVERGWKVGQRVQCPACQRKLSVAAYRKARREHAL